MYSRIQTTVKKTDALRIKSLGKSYADLDALEPLDLTVARGESIALVGHNGSGKSTLLRLLAGLLEASSGTARVMGHPIGTVDARAALSFIPDDPVLYDDLSVREHVEYISRLHGGPGCDAVAEALIEQLGLAHRADALARLRHRARGVVFAVAEPRVRWNTGDSALAAYAPHCDLLLETVSLGELLRALRAAAVR